MGMLTRAIKAAWNEANKPETFVKGDEFEEFVRKHVFPQTDYVLLARTHDYESNKNDFIQSSKDPDFKFKSQKNGKIFFVEAKYRSAYIDGAIEWCKPYQLTRYEAIDKATPVYVVIGVGNSPASPERVFLVPLKRTNGYLRLFRTFLKQYEIPLDRGISVQKLNSLSKND